MSTALYFVVNDAFYNKALPKGHLPEGVIFGSLKEVAAEHPELVKKYYGKLAVHHEVDICAEDVHQLNRLLHDYILRNVEDNAILCKSCVESCHTVF